MAPSASQRVHVWISGRVQGVGFRAATERAALQIGVCGWVRNLADGRVEAVFEGSPERVEQIVRWCDQGSPAAVVESVVAEVENPEGLRNFSIRPTAR